MTADAFSVTVWALVLASVLAPLGFGIMLRRHMRSEKRKDDEDIPSTVRAQYRTVCCGTVTDLRYCDCECVPAAMHRCLPQPAHHCGNLHGQGESGEG